MQFDIELLRSIGPNDHERANDLLQQMGFRVPSDAEIEATIAIDAALRKLVTQLQPAT